MVLTEKQRRELHNAIYEYLIAGGQGEDSGSPSFVDSAAAFAREAGIDTSTASESSTKSLTLLEKKWTSIVRLQKKVLNLEASLRDAQQHVSLVGKGAAPVLNGAVKGTFNLNTTPRHTMSGHRGPILSLAIHPRFNLLVSTSEDATTKIWDFETGEFERTLKGHSNSVQSACFNADGSLLATCSSDLSIKLWDFSTFKCISTLMGHEHNVTGVVFAPDGNKLISCSRDKTIKVWEVSTGYCIKTLRGHSEWVRKVAVDLRSNDVIASCSSDHSLSVWNVTSGARVSEMRGHEHVVECVTFATATADKAIIRGQRGSKEPENVAGEGKEGSDRSSGSLHLISGSRDRTVRIWLVASGALLFTLVGHDSWVRGVACQPSGKYLLSTGEDRTIRVWDIAQQRCIRTIQEAHEHFVTTLCPHPSLAIVASGSVDTNIKIWTGVPV